MIRCCSSSSSSRHIHSARWARGARQLFGRGRRRVSHLGRPPSHPRSRGGATVAPSRPAPPRSRLRDHAIGARRGFVASSPSATAGSSTGFGVVPPPCGVGDDDGTNKTLVIDTHSHVYHPSYVEILRRRTDVPRVVRNPSTGEDRLVILPNEDRSSAPAGRPFPSDFWEVERKLEYMDRHGIDVSVLSLANPWLNFLEYGGRGGGGAAGGKTTVTPPEEAAEMADALNADLDRTCSAVNERRGRTTLLGFGVIPTVPGVEEGAAASTLRRIDEDLPNMRGVILGTTGVAGEGLDSERMEPLYEELEGRGLVLFVHPHYGLRGEDMTTAPASGGSGAGGDGADYGHSLELALGFPFETSIAVSRLVLSGVLDRYPGLEVLVAHAGGALPWLHGRLDSCAEYERGDGTKSSSAIARLKKHPPTEYLKDLYYDAIIYDSDNLDKLVRMVGPDRITFGTDHPFFPPVGGGDEWESCTKVQRNIADQGGAIAKEIFGGTAATLFGLDSAKPLEKETPISADTDESDLPSFGYFARNRERKKPSGAAEQFDVVSPVTNEPIFRVSGNTPEEVNDIIDGAHDSYLRTEWGTDRILRYDVLMRASSILKSPEVLDRLADLESQQIGRPRREMRFQLGRLHEWFDYYACLLRVHEDRVVPFGTGNGTGGDYLNYVTREPLGVVGLITPWNHPLLITVKKLAAALAGGNTVVIKPSELAPCSVLEFVRMLHADDKNGQGGGELPDNVMSVVQGDGDVGRALVAHPSVQKIDFTGGTETFRAIGADAGRNLAKYTSELGGKSPMLVFCPPDPQRMDPSLCAEYIDRVANNAIFGCFIASGQTCIAGTRLIIQEDEGGSFHQDLIDNVVDKVRRLKVGDPFDAETDLGPVISAKQLDLIDGIVKTLPANVHVLCGGKKVASRGNFYEPTVLLVSNDEDLPLPDVFHTELFGPVLTVITAKSDQEVIDLANATPYSLGCSIWSQNISQAHQAAKRVRSGIVWINDHHKNDPCSPWGGMGKMSGVGRENGVDAFLDYTQPKSVVVNTAYDEDRVGLCANNQWFSSCRKPGSSGENARYN